MVSHSLLPTPLSSDLASLSATVGCRTDNSDDLNQELEIHQLRLGRLLAQVQTWTGSSELERTAVRMVLEELIALRSTLHSLPPTINGLRTARNLTDRLRSALRLGAAAVTAGDWQSPSFAHAQRSRCGRNADRVGEHYFEYKRTEHFDSLEYERLYADEYLPQIPGLQVLLTSSGMGALAAALFYLRKISGVRGDAILVTPTYYENRELIEQWGSIQIPFRDEDALIADILRYDQPVVLFDLLVNAPGGKPIDAKRVIEGVIRGGKRDQIFILDSTNEPLALSGLLSSIEIPAETRIFAYESGIKHHQFGLDLTNAGILVAVDQTPTAPDLFRAAERLGNILSDTASVLLPRPDKTLLRLRSERASRNGATLATFLNFEFERYGIQSVRALHQENHPRCYDGGSQSRVGAAPLIYLDDTSGRIDATGWTALRNQAISTLSPLGVELLGSTGYLFDQTRLSLVKTPPFFPRPVLRLAVGQESRAELQVIARAFAMNLRGHKDV